MAELRSCASARFNGAVDERRRRVDADDVVVLATFASMGPSTNVDGEA
jgi:hypothetical protein